MSSKQKRTSAPFFTTDTQNSYLNSLILIFTNTSGSVLTCVCAYVCVCVCANRGGTPLCTIQRAQPRKVEIEMTCRHVNKINNIRLYSLFNKRTR